jgi:hypothetical protein
MHILFYALLPAITSGLDLAKVSQLAAQERRIKNAPPPEPLNIKQRRQLFGLTGISLSEEGDCKSSFGRIARQSVARAVSISCAKIEKRPLGAVDLGKATDPIKAFNKYCKAATTPTNFASAVNDILGICLYQA